MLDRLATLAHGLRIGIEALLHGLEQMLVLPSRNPSFRPCRALRFERALRTCRGPVAPQHLASFLVRIAITTARRVSHAGPQVFYNNEDLWTLPNEKYGGSSLPIDPYYILMRLPGEDELQFILMTPLTRADETT